MSESTAFNRAINAPVLRKVAGQNSGGTSHKPGLPEGTSPTTHHRLAALASPEGLSAIGLAIKITGPIVFLMVPVLRGREQSQRSSIHLCVPVMLA